MTSSYTPKNILAFFLLLSIPFFTIAQNAAVKKDSIPNGTIHQQQFILINGIQQWVTVNGESSKPVILFLHGGPDSPISPYSDALLKSWEKDFLLVQWDQRGTGKTFGYAAPKDLNARYLKANPLTLEQITADGIELSEYLVKTFSKQKLILFGTSWGSAVGVKMASKRPDLFYAYIGHSQIVTPSNDLALYNIVYPKAKKANDNASLEILDAIGRPPYAKAKSTGLLLRVVKKYERLNATPAPESWFIVSPDYDTPTARQHQNDGDDYSFINYIGDKGLGIPSIRSTINLMKDNLNFKVPVYLIQGNEDLLTPKEMTKNYFNKIKAPQKKYFLLLKTAHGFNASVMETLYKICRGIKAR